ncbi:MAG: hypothetical protein AB7O52_03095 [Planctomycetota bacterium]
MARALCALYFVAASSLLIAGCSHAAPARPEPEPESIAPAAQFLSVELMLFVGPLPALSNVGVAPGPEPHDLDAVAFHQLAECLASDPAFTLVSTPRLLTELDQSATLTIADPSRHALNLSVCIRGNTGPDGLALELSVQGWCESQVELANGHGAALVIVPDSHAASHTSVALLVRPSLVDRP